MKRGSSERDIKKRSYELSKIIESTSISPFNQYISPQNQRSFSNHFSRVSSKNNHEAGSFATIRDSCKNEKKFDLRKVREAKIHRFNTNLDKKFEFKEKILKIDIDADAIPTQRLSPCRASLFPKDPLTKELYEHKIMLSAYQKLSETPQKKIDNKRPTTTSPSHKRRSILDREASGFQYKKLLSRLSLDRSKEKNEIAIEDDDFLRKTLKKHEEQVIRSEKIKKEIDSIHESYNELSRSMEKQKVRSSSLQNLFIEKDELKSPRNLTLDHKIKKKFFGEVKNKISSNNARGSQKIILIPRIRHRKPRNVISFLADSLAISPASLSSKQSRSALSTAPAGKRYENKL
ncbi:unnamed protein product [Blepharisma stoltei]|uniref:Uncharacterized protein n=1 Tax=Blepharisma stoltei TaxID=1481888 RepID=A0AAU9J1G8_9CILI|nr:unnamed protein product [Blepharisma stoltei]